MLRATCRAQHNDDGAMRGADTRYATRVYTRASAVYSLRLIMPPMFAACYAMPPMLPRAQRARCCLARLWLICCRVFDARESLCRRCRESRMPRGGVRRRQRRHRRCAMLPCHASAREERLRCAMPRAADLMPRRETPTTCAAFVARSVERASDARCARCAPRRERKIYARLMIMPLIRLRRLFTLFAITI